MAKHSFYLLLLLVISLLPGRVSHSGQLNPTWIALTPTSGAPVARRDGALVYDPLHHQLLLFGGRNQAGLLADTWAFDLGSLSWQELVPAGDPHPPARFSMVAGFDTAHNRLLITTGEGESDFFNDVWSFDLTTNSWSALIVNGNKPTERYGAAGAISGDGNWLYLTHGFTTSGRFDDSWAFHLGNHSWVNISPGGQRPLPRCLHTAAMSGTNGLVLFGGCASGFGPCPLNDTWVLSNNSWSEVGTATRPEPRQFTSLVATTTAQQFLLFGGEGDGGSNLNDLWLLDTAQATWQQWQPAGTAPAGRRGHNALWIHGFSGNGGYMVVFGGRGDSQLYFNDLWLLAPNGTIAPETIQWQENSPAGFINQPLSFTATVGPAPAGQPITYLWQASEQANVQHSGGLVDTATYQWATIGPKTITVTASNPAGQLTISQTIQLLTPTHFTYLPLIHR